MTTPTSHRGTPSEDERQDPVVGIFPKHCRCWTCRQGLANHPAYTLAQVSA